MDTAEDGRAPERTGTAEDGDAERNLDVFATYTKWGLKHDREVTAGILGVTEELYARYQESGMDGISEEEDALLTQVADAFRENYWLNKWLKFRFSSGVTRNVTLINFARYLLLLFRFASLNGIVFLLSIISCAPFLLFRKFVLFLRFRLFLF